jgi:hypothetical protein
MRPIFLIGINFVRTQWIALAVMSAYVLGIGGVYRVHTLSGHFAPYRTTARKK